MTAITESADTKAIKALIKAFFDAINAADTDALQSHFLPSTTLSIFRQDPPAAPDRVPARDRADSKITVLLRTTIEAFVRMIEDGKKRREGKPGLPVLHEWPLLHEVEVRLDAGFAVAWCPFRVSFDGELHHYGTMVFSLGFTSTPGGESPDDKVWKIIGLEQSYRRTPGWEGRSGELMSK